jgi:hypothetical protein
MWWFSENGKCGFLNSCLISHFILHFTEIKWLPRAFRLFKKNLDYLSSNLAQFYWLLMVSDNLWIFVYFCHLFSPIQWTNKVCNFITALPRFFLRPFFLWCSLFTYYTHTQLKQIKILWITWTALYLQTSKTVQIVSRSAWPFLDGD